MLAVAGGKGGCGKTTTAVGLARGLAALGARPLVVDADLDMPDLHHRTGVDRAPGIAAAVDSGDPHAVAQRSGRFPEIDVLPSAGADTATAAALFERLGGGGGETTQGAPVVLDCPAGASPDAAAPLRAADRTVLVSTPRERSLRDAAKTAAMARQLDAPPAAVVLVRSDGRVDPSELLGCDQVVHVPELSEPPLETQESAARHRQCAKSLPKRNI
ncbi:MinD/ParA family ATP-binding protein [Haloarcula onubensis]|uniref:P-loop NTPase n=1 Tax=Haloarcula onubensis TaxID=2950539 RepID=A0ABU2FL08_9EURY|nr:P-loop NTPase [Halomicroarcula sp. S3CR25-11]MDS0281446.1 P-loop NTPase [Halomicroarcula sp. S3CR25-11]